MKIAVIGSRSFNDFVILKQILDEFLELSLIVSGGAKGADQLAVQYAFTRSIPTRIFNPNWSVHKRGAGHRRNELIIKESDLVLAFWDGNSKGTSNTIELSKKLGKPIRIVRFKMNENIS